MKTTFNAIGLTLFLLTTISTTSFAQGPGGGGLPGGGGGIGGLLGGAAAGTDTTVVVDSIPVPLACAGSRVTFLYHKTITFNPGNTFRAQLVSSPANILLGGGGIGGLLGGLTQQPIDLLPASAATSGGIGSLIGAIGGSYPTSGGIGDTLSFTGTVPLSTPTGIYNIRIISSNPSDTSVNSSGFLLVSSPTVSTSVTCINDSIFLTAVTGGDSPVLSALVGTLLGSGIGTLLGGSNIPFIWSNGDTSLTTYASVPAIYTATYTDTTFGCSVTSSKTVADNPILVDCQMTKVSFSSAVDASSYTWTVDSSTYATSKSIVFNNDITRTYNLYTQNPYTCVTISTDPSVCADSNSISVYVPTLFTPNGDGKNDVLYVRGNNIKELYFAVYNRWGEMIFETDDVQKGWDGTYKDAEVDPTILVWYLRIVNHEGDRKEEKGHVTLMR